MKHSTKFNFLMNAILTASAFIFPLITYPYISRVLGPDNIGKVSLATSVVYYFGMFAQLGIPTYGINACARVRDNRRELTKTVQEIMIINLIMTAVVYAVFAVSLFAVPRLAAEKPLYIITGVTILFSTIGVEWLYKAVEQYSYITTVSILFKFISVAAMFAFVHNEGDYVIYGGITIIAASGSGLLNFIRLRRFISLKPVGHYDLRQHLRAIWVFFAMSVATTIYTNLDVVMLGFIKTDADVGYYNTAVKVKNVLCALVTSLGTVLLPRMSCLAKEEKWNEFYGLAKKSINFVLLLSLPLALFFAVFANESIRLLSGDAFLPAVLPMQVISFTVVFIGLTNIMGIQVLVPLGREKQVLGSEVAGALVNLFFNATLIPLCAATGAAIGTLLAEAMVFIYQYYVLRDVARPVFSKIAYWKILLALLVGCAMSVPIKLLSFRPFSGLLVAAVLFFGSYLAVLLIAKETLTRELIGQFIGKITAPFKRKKH